MSELILMMGTPGSGKSHCRNRDLPDAHVISPDDIIVEWSGGVYLWTPNKAAAAWREADTRLELEMLEAADDGMFRRIVFDAVFDTPKRRKKYIALAKKYGWGITAYYVKTPYDVCRLRNDARPETRRVPEETLERMASRMTAPTRSEGFDEIVVISGTL